MVLDIINNARIKPGTQKSEIHIYYDGQLKHVLVDIEADLLTLGIAAKVLQLKFDKALAALSADEVDKKAMNETIEREVMGPWIK